MLARRGQILLTTISKGWLLSSGIMLPRKIMLMWEPCTSWDRIWPSGSTDFPQEFQGFYRSWWSWVGQMQGWSTFLRTISSRFPIWFRLPLETTWSNNSMEVFSSPTQNFKKSTSATMPFRPSEKAFSTGWKICQKWTSRTTCASAARWCTHPTSSEQKLSSCGCVRLDKTRKYCNRSLRCHILERRYMGWRFSKMGSCKKNSFKKIIPAFQKFVPINKVLFEISTDYIRRACISSLRVFLRVPYISYGHSLSRTLKFIFFCFNFQL